MSCASCHLIRSAARVVALLVVAALALFASPGRGGAVGNTIASPDSGGQFTSVALDTLGNPVISHYDPANGDLKIVHCGTPACNVGNVLASLDTTNDVGQYTSLKLDANGHPVVSYYDASLFALKVLHCGDANCGTGNTITLPATTPEHDHTGLYSSLALDGSGNPVVSFYTVPFDVLKVTHCNDPACNSSTSNYADPGNVVGYYSSLALDASGLPVVSYFDQTNGDLKVVHCGDANCSAGNTIVSPDTLGEVGLYTSIALDAIGRPVVSYYDQTAGKLKVLHCGNATCSAGNSIAAPDGAGASYTSIKLDTSGHPVISYYSSTGANLRVIHCGDANCASGNVAVTADSTGDVGQYTSLALDAGGNPVVSYYDATNGMLKVLHCSDPNCTGSSPAVGGITQLPDVSSAGRSGNATLPLLLLGTLFAAGIAAGAAAYRARRARRDA